MTYDPSANHELDHPSADSVSLPPPDRPAPKPRRGPAGETEAWAARAIVLIAGLDPDGARVRNGAGFSSADSEFGCSLAAAIVKYGPRMTERQWPLVVRLATRYRGQVEATDPMPVTSAQAQTAQAPATAPISDPPDVQRVRGEIRAGEARLDAILALPVERGGYRCLNTDAPDQPFPFYPPGFGSCGTCALAAVKTCHSCATGNGHAGSDCEGSHRNKVCKAMSYIWSRRAWLAEMRGDHEASKMLREDFGLDIAH